MDINVFDSFCAIILDWLSTRFLYPDFIKVTSKNSRFDKKTNNDDIKKTFQCFWPSVGILLLITQSQCPHCSFALYSNLLDTSLKITMKAIYRSHLNNFICVNLNFAESRPSYHSMPKRIPKPEGYSFKLRP